LVALIVSWFCHASGIIIMTAWGSERPLRTSSSTALSKLPESLVAGSQIGKSFVTSSKSGDANIAWRATIQFRLPRSVLISPLCAMKRYGCARSHDGNVLVEKRWWTSASADTKAVSVRS
jgi:hypothetical protein